MCLSTRLNRALKLPDVTSSASASVRFSLILSRVTLNFCPDFVHKLFCSVMEKAIGESQQVSETTERMATDTTYAMSLYLSILLRHHW